MTMDPPTSIPPVVFQSNRSFTLKEHWELESFEKLMTDGERTFPNSGNFDPAVISEDFRAGFPGPLPGLPLHTGAPQAEDPRIPLWTQCQAEAASIVQEAKIDFTEIETSMAKGVDEPQETEANPTILITVKDSTDKALWRPTLNSIGHMLHVHDALDLHVIIMDPKAEENKHAFCLPVDHPIIELWPKKLQGPVLELVEEFSWLSVGVSNWGLTEHNAKPTIVIIVKDKKQDPWDELTREILQICAAGGAPYLEVAVEEGELF